MSIVEDDPLAVLPVTAAAASAAFARATDTTRGAVERQLAAVRRSLALAERLLERGESVVEQLAVQIERLERDQQGEPCTGVVPMCDRCIGVPLKRSGGVAVCLECGLVKELPQAESRCTESARVTLGSAAQRQRRSPSAGRMPPSLASATATCTWRPPPGWTARCSRKRPGRAPSSGPGRRYPPTEAEMHEEDLRQLPVIVDLMTAAVLGGRTTAYEMVRSGRWPTPVLRVSRLFARLLKEADLPPVRLHDLRHGAATLAPAGGANLKVVSEMLGHSTIAITADTCTSVLPEVAREAAEAAVRLVPARRRRDAASPYCPHLAINDRPPRGRQ